MTRPRVSQTGQRRKHHLVLYILLVVAVSATAGLMLWYWPLAWVPAVLAAVIYGTALAIWMVDRRIRSEPALGPMSGVARDQTVLAAEEKVGLRIALIIGTSLAMIATVVAAVLFEWKFVGVGALAVFAWMVLLGLPFWAAAVEEEVEAEHAQLTGETRSIQ